MTRSSVKFQSKQSQSGLQRPVRVRVSVRACVGAAGMRLPPSAQGKHWLYLRDWRGNLSQQSTLKCDHKSSHKAATQRAGLTVPPSTRGSALEFGPSSADCSPAAPQNTRRARGTSSRRLPTRSGAPRRATEPRPSPQNCEAPWRGAFSSRSADEELQRARAHPPKVALKKSQRCCFKPLFGP